MPASRSSSARASRRILIAGGSLNAHAVLRWVADSRAAPFLILPLAVAERLAWTFAGHTADMPTELRRVAIGWARTGWIADAFAPGTGPTAHVGVLPVLVPGLVFRLCGGPGLAATLILTAISAMVVVAAGLVLNRLFARLGTPAAARGAALGVICLLPLHYELESRSLRVYENGWAALSIALTALAAVRLDQRGQVSLVDMVGLSSLAALLFALSPIAGVAAIAILGVLALRRLAWPRQVLALGVLSAALLITCAPWALRNRALLGETIWTRGNFGLEFAVGTHAGAVNPRDPATVYLARLAAIHPDTNPPALAAMRQAGGETAYARQLGAATWAWVSAHPFAALTIWLRHLREFWFPPPWMWHHTALPDATMPFRIVVVDLIAVLALVGLGSALARGQSLYWYAAAPLVVLPLPYVLTQPLVRYRYAIAALLIFLAADCLARLRAARAQA